MMFRSLLITLALVGCSSAELEESALYDYSAPEEAQDLLLTAAVVVNEAAGCTLVGHAPAGSFVNPIVVQESHAGGPNVVGCAFMGEALKRAEHPRDTILVEWILTDKVGVLTTAHEVGHTLGLPHVFEPYTIMYPVVSDSLVWDDASKAQLQALCELEPETTAALDELVVDRSN
jgi:hypothetical protein